MDKYESVTISAAQIKEFREPRLMAKFDHSINLPQIFTENQLAILPISRGDYVISHFITYKLFENLDTSINKANLPSYIQSLDTNNISSEAIAINCAYASGILADFLEEDNLHPTVSGRMGSGCFDFYIKNSRNQMLSHVEVNKSQIEIDAAFEGINSLALIEAKRDISDDFLVRQLYYPFRTLSKRVSKKVKPVFLVYSNGIFNLYEYSFMEPYSYNSLVLIKQKNYSIEDTEIGMKDLLTVMRQVSLQPEPEIPFPQADNFQRVINICELLLAQELSRDDITNEYAFDIRQTNYYTDAARYLGLIDKRYEERKPIYTLNETGKRIISLHYKQRQLALCQCILQHKAFFETFKVYIEKGIIPNRNAIMEIMKNSDLYRVDSESTFLRRASTISGWINWIIDLV